MVNKGEFYNAMTDEEQQAGWIKFNIPDPATPRDQNGEGVWGWLSPEDKEKWADDSFTGKLKAILLNDPLRYAGQLLCGHEVVIQCQGKNRPILDPEWAAENLEGPEHGEIRNWIVRLNGEVVTTIEADCRYDAVKDAMLLASGSGLSWDLFSVEEAKLV